jgi:flagellar basal body-associated protein FliL
MVKNNFSSKTTFIIILIAISVLLVACSSASISSIKKDSMINEKVSIKGEVSSSIMLGSFSGFTINDGSDDIFVSSDTVYSQGKKIRVSGIVKHNILVGYYIETK